MKSSAILSSAEEGKLRTDASSEVREREREREREKQQAEIDLSSDMTDTYSVYSDLVNNNNQVVWQLVNWQIS